MALLTKRTWAKIAAVAAAGALAAGALMAEGCSWRTGVWMDGKPLSSAQGRAFSSGVPSFLFSSGVVFYDGLTILDGDAIEGVKRIQVDWPSGDVLVEVLSGNAPAVKLEERASGPAKALAWRVEGDVLKVEDASPWYASNPEKDLRLGIPGYFFDEVSVRADAGDIQVNARCGRLEATARQGAVDVSGSYDELSAEALQGGVSLSATVADTLRVVAGRSSQLSFGAAFPSEMELDIRAGLVELALPRTASVLLDASGFSGALNSSLGLEPLDRDGCYRYQGGASSLRVVGDGGSLVVEEAEE